MHHTDPSKIQALSLQLVEKITQIYDHNEKLVNYRNGETNFYSRVNQRKTFVEMKRKRRNRKRTPVFQLDLCSPSYISHVAETQQGQQRNQGAGGGTGGGQNWSECSIQLHS